MDENAATADSELRCKTIGVAGCGTMGLPMAERLADAGFRVLGYDVRPQAEFSTNRITMSADAADFAQQVDVLISVVRDKAQTEALLFDTQNVMGGPRPPGTVVVSSTLSPRFVADLRQRLAVEVTLVDAPMSGAPYRAKTGELTFMVGGDDAAVQALMPAFSIMGRDVFHLGPVGAGMTIKVLNNYCAATGVVATRRALDIARRLGVDQRQLLDVMRQSSGANWYADNIDSIDWSRQGYALDNTIGIVEKDVNSLLDACAAIDGLTPSTLDGAILEALRSLEEIDID